MSSKLPFFSIIVPTYGRSRQLSLCLQAIAALEYPYDRFEVLVVNDGAENPPEALINGFRNGLDITLLTQSHAGPATARNYGASKAKGEYLAFTDDDCLPLPDWLQTLAVRFLNLPDCVIGGKTLNGYSENLYSTASQFLIDYLYTYYNSDPYQARFLTSNNLAMPTNLFWKHGGFDKTFPKAAAEDRELCDRLSNFGNNIRYAPEVLVYHFHDLTLHSFCRQHFNYGVGAYRFHKIRAERNDMPINVEPLPFYLNLMRFPISRTSASQAFSLTALLFTSQAANALGYFWQKFFGAGNGSNHKLEKNESAD